MKNVLTIANQLREPHDGGSEQREIFAVANSTLIYSARSQRVLCNEVKDWEFTWWVLDAHVHYFFIVRV